MRHLLYTLPGADVRPGFLARECVGFAPVPPPPKYEQCFIFLPIGRLIFVSAGRDTDPGNIGRLFYFHTAFKP
jgi:hypothetical protein